MRYEEPIERAQLGELMWAWLRVMVALVATFWLLAFVESADIVEFCRALAVAVALFALRWVLRK